MADGEQFAGGGCSCGEIRYRGLCAPDQVLVCHCPDCRRSSGAQSVAWLFISSDSFEFTQGEPTEFASSPGVIRKFCGTCGTTLSWEGDKQPGRIDVTVGSLDSPQDYPPTKAVYRKHRLPWASEI
ncbi:MAG: GFA family protein [Pseudomonadales bacterium]|nr:GFA family protein [Pseudomonadales bacterium]